MIKKSTLSTKSKVFVVSNRKESSKAAKQDLSVEKAREDPQKSMVTENFKISFGPNIVRKMAADANDDEWGSECSYQSASTNGSVRRYEQYDGSSERSDDSCNSRTTEGNSDKEVYNNFDQKHPIRNPVFHIKHSITEIANSKTAEISINGDVTTNDASPVHHKKTRRGGKKNRAQNRVKEADKKSTSDKVVTKYKTELCKNWIEKGKWNYSIRCRFAHGPHELVQNIAEHETEEYKSKPCVAYHENSYCPYGVRCLFIHESRKICDLTNSYYSKNLLLSEEAKSTLPCKRLRVFEALSCCND